MDKRPGCGNDVEMMMMRILVLIIIWYQDEVCKSRIKIIWVITSQDHVIGRFADYYITPITSRSKSIIKKWNLGATQ